MRTLTYLFLLLVSALISVSQCQVCSILSVQEYRDPICQDKSLSTNAEEMQKQIQAAISTGDCYFQSEFFQKGPSINASCIGKQEFQLYTYFDARDDSKCYKYSSTTVMQNITEGLCVQLSWGSHLIQRKGYYKFKMTVGGGENNDALEQYALETLDAGFIVLFIVCPILCVCGCVYLCCKRHKQQQLEAQKQKTVVTVIQKQPEASQAVEPNAAPNVPPQPNMQMAQYPPNMQMAQYPPNMQMAQYPPQQQMVMQPPNMAYGQPVVQMPADGMYGGQPPMPYGQPAMPMQQMPMMNQQEQAQMQMEFQQMAQLGYNRQNDPSMKYSLYDPSKSQQQVPMPQQMAPLGGPQQLFSDQQQYPGNQAPLNYDQINVELQSMPPQSMPPKQV